MIDELDETDLAHRVVFLQADEQTLIDRYKETRRRHPLAPQGNVVDGIRARDGAAGARSRSAPTCASTPRG